MTKIERNTIKQTKPEHTVTEGLQLIQCLYNDNGNQNKYNHKGSGAQAWTKPYGV